MTRMFALALAFPGIACVLHAQVETVQVHPATASVTAGRTVQFTVVAKDARGVVVTPAPAVNWAIGPFEIAVVDRAGKVNTFREGKARVLAIVDGKTGRADLEILPKPPTMLEVAAETPDVVVGGLTRVTAEARTEDREPRRGVAIAYRSSNPRVATVGPGGEVTGVAPGEARVIAEAEGLRAETTIRVVPNPVRQLTVSGPSSARTGDVVPFQVKAQDSEGQTLPKVPVRWMVSGGGATVFPDGGFVAERPGSYIVNAVVGSTTASASITVGPRVHGRTLEAVTSRIFSDLSAAEVWAVGDALYVSTAAGRVYAYDISDAANPVLADSVMVDARLVNDVSTTADGKIGVITREGASSRRNGIVFLDLSSPLHPKVLSEYTETVTGGVHSAFIHDHYVYLTDDATRRLRIIDFQDPKSPKEVGRWEIEGPTVRTDSGTGRVSGRYLHDLQVKDGLAYLAYFKHGLVILDVGNGIKGGSPESPKFVSQFTYSTTDFYPPDMLAGTHSVFRYKNYVFVGDEVFPQFFNTANRDRIKTLGRIHILDVSNIELPRKVAEYHVHEQGSHNYWVADDVLYIGNFEAGVRAVDVSGELRGDLMAQGREIGNVWTGSPNGFRANLPMTWGVHPHKGLVYASDMNSGLWVVRLTPRHVP